MINILEQRKKQIYKKGEKHFDMKCETTSLAGSVSQRACVFCGSRVVLYPIADALHLVHGPIGCAVYTWDIRGALSSGPELHRNSFSTDLNEIDVIYGGEKKLLSTLIELIERYQPKAAFVYATCIAGLIGDDVSSICKKVAGLTRIPVIPVQSEGFKGTKKDGYAAACHALFSLIGTSGNEQKVPFSINILGDFNLAGETWIIKEYYARIGINVVATMTGDGRIDDIRGANRAELNVVQCSGSMTTLAKLMQEKFQIPFIKVSYFGIEDMSEALYSVVRHFDNREIMEKTTKLVSSEIERIMPTIADYRRKLSGKNAAVYVGGAFKAFSLIKSLRHLGMNVVVAGSQTGNNDDYTLLKDLSDEGTIIVDDTNPLELSKFIQEKKVDILIGGVKERPIAYKLGLGFCDHNHERKIALAGYEGMLNFAKEVYSTIMSPVWQFRVSREGTEDI
ncbi:MAG: nitrogenase iron-molybdenum cofactor biosynthesis protein NifE [Candidatus Margulisbacteria bacterium GWF2_38_17]|nr:MAG: nitrogenase iron-molybdenum cofactor biosynthesis protein NifE [Candidatus Margulisbacteria bacterium GWD2_39_127]OGI01832.1 MAG: nitrogenase iron-molybdenum cofactor biosynthesis protein NifE [Candidatus Margulisbacteria bacterium GWF2_38_17]OGI10154.1 MAG: nitrogenase iron-molybdenum cofactor biosynthesis protein NifE [Candidatus Margulisbacteria bacterium GWE2_39_32]